MTTPPPGEQDAVRPATSPDLDTVAGLARGSAGLVRHQGTEQHLDTWINRARQAGCPESAASPPAWITATPPDSSRRLLRRRNRMATCGGARAS